MILKCILNILFQKSFLKHQGVLLFVFNICGCCDKIPQIQELWRKTDIYCLLVQDARNPKLESLGLKSRYWQGHITAVITAILQTTTTSTISAANVTTSTTSTIIMNAITSVSPSTPKPPLLTTTITKWALLVPLLVLWWLVPLMLLLPFPPRVWGNWLIPAYEIWLAASLLYSVFTFEAGAQW